MAQNLNPAIELLVTQIDDLERKANAYKASVNVLCEKDGLPPMFPDDGGGSRRLNGQGASEPAVRSATPALIKADAFYGKPQQTAVRELFAMRKAAGNGAAKPAEILEGLRAGGYVVEAKNDEIALVGLRAMLRKRNTIFHKLPNGTWGLKEWYPNAKAPKEATDKPVTATVKDADIAVAGDEELTAKTEAAETNEASAAA